jgi:hypothetical protein
MNNTEGFQTLQSFYTGAEDCLINCSCIGYTKNVFCAADNQKRVILWSIKKSEPRLVLEGAQSDISCITFNKATTATYVGTTSGTIYGWDLNTECRISKYGGHMTETRFIETGQTEDDENLMLSGSGDTNLKLWDIRTKKAVKTFKGHTKGVNCGKFSPDGEWIVSGDDAGDIMVWDMKTEKVVRTLGSPNQKAVVSLVFNPKTYTMASGSANK